MKKLFRAKIFHKRLSPKVNEFTYNGFYIQFPIDEMHTLKSSLFSINRFNLFSFYERDHGYRNGASLRNWAEDLLLKAGVVFRGKIILQTFPRMLGYVFNPVSFWYCYQGDELIAVICEVNNTFGENHNYVLINNPGQEKINLKKEFHVSPFYEVKGDYIFNFTRKNFVSINYFQNKELQLLTSIKGNEIDFSDLSLLKTFFRFPFYTMFVVGLIHYQALKLFFKKIQFYSKPVKSGRDFTYEHIK